MYIYINQDNIKRELEYMSIDIDNLYNAINYTKGNVESISGIWQGEDYNNFQEKVNDFLEEIKKIANLMNNYKEFLASYKDASKKLEENYKSKKIQLN